jgi:hypothetical protein
MGMARFASASMNRQCQPPDIANSELILAAFIVQTRRGASGRPNSNRNLL